MRQSTLFGFTARKWPFFFWEYRSSWGLLQVYRGAMAGRNHPQPPGFLPIRPAMLKGGFRAGEAVSHWPPPLTVLMTSADCKRGGVSCNYKISETWSAECMFVLGGGWMGEPRKEHCSLKKVSRKRTKGKYTRELVFVLFAVLAPEPIPQRNNVQKISRPLPFGLWIIT